MCAINDYVFASRWSDKDWNDPWCIGYVFDVKLDRVLLHDGKGNIIGRSRWWPNWEVISEDLGLKIIEAYPQLEGQCFDQEIFNEIWYDDPKLQEGAYI